MVGYDFGSPAKRVVPGRDFSAGCMGFLKMPVFANYDFNDPDSTLRDTALENGAQNGISMHDAVTEGGRLQLNGTSAFGKIYDAPMFQADRGTVSVEFSQAAHNGEGPNTVLSRDNDQNDNGFRLDVLADGSVHIRHESAAGEVNYQTAPGFSTPGDSIELSYSWDFGGSEPGRLAIVNQTSGARHFEPVPNTVTMEMPDASVKWLIGTSQVAAPGSELAPLQDYFQGSVGHLSFSDSVDNANTAPDAVADTAATAAGAAVIIPVLANDTDADGDPLSVTTATAGNGSVVVNDDGTLSYTPADGFSGPDQITYTVSDGQGGSDSATVTVDVAGDGGPVTVRDGIVWGTDAGEFIGPDYTGDNDGDMVDNYDALLPGAVGDDDEIRAGGGNDTVRANIGNDLVYGGAGNDEIYGINGNDTLHGDEGGDFIDAGEGDDLVYGGAGWDTLKGGIGADSLYGGDDRDFFIDANAGDFIDGGSGGDDWDMLDLRGMGPLRVHHDEDNHENGHIVFFDDEGKEIGRAEFRDIEKIVPCFTPGTLIATARGPVPAEDIRVGDRVITRDNGLQEVRWTGARKLSAAELGMASHLQPVLIRRGALGHGLPERDMLVSPNHRVLVANDRTALYFDEHEVLVAAKHLVGGEGITGVRSSGTTYLHFMCDRHEVVMSDGAWTETFQPGDQTLNGMGNAQRNEIFELFPDLRNSQGIDSYVAARKTLKKHEALLLRR